MINTINLKAALNHMIKLTAQKEIFVQNIDTSIPSSLKTLICLVWIGKILLTFHFLKKVKLLIPFLKNQISSNNIDELLIQNRIDLC